jgi:hypothetical protein
MWKINLSPFALGNAAFLQTKMDESISLNTRRHNPSEPPLALEPIGPTEGDTGATRCNSKDERTGEGALPTSPRVHVGMPNEGGAGT